MAEQPEDDKGERKKLSIGEALEAMRQGRSQKGVSALATAELALRQQRMPPAYWLQHLQHHLQKGRDQLYNSICSDGSALSGMRRRDLVATELFHVPTGCMEHVVNHAASQRPDLSRGQELEAACYSPLDYSRRFQPENAPLKSQAREVTQYREPLGNFVPGGRFEASDVLHLEGCIEEVQHALAPDQPKRLELHSRLRAMLESRNNH